MPLVLIQVYLRNVEDSVLENSLSILWLTKKQAKEQKATAIGQLHDDVILLQLPESFSLLFSCAN